MAGAGAGVGAGVGAGAGSDGVGSDGAGALPDTQPAFKAASTISPSVIDDLSRWFNLIVAKRLAARISVAV